MAKNPEKIVDLGCGKGVFLDFVSKLNKNALCIGVDFGRKNCTRTQENKHVALCGDAALPPLKSNSVDVVFLFDVIEHFSHPTILSEIHRILKDDGVLLLSTPNKFGVYEHKQLVNLEMVVFYPQDIWNGLKGKPRSYAPYHLKLYSNKELIQVLQDNGFEILDSRFSGFCFPFLGTVRTVFASIKKEDIFESIFKGRLIKILEIFEKRLWVFNFLIIVHAKKKSAK